jgi:outer membrane protein assembly factor BamB
MIADNFTFPGRLVLAAAALMSLLACGEPEVILPGEREDLRPTDVTAPDAAGNRSRAISLPAATNNAEWPQSFGTQAFRVAHPALRSSPQRIWSVEIGAGDSRRQRITAAPVVGAGRVYALDAGAQVTAVSTGGAVLWRADLTPSRGRAGDATGGGLAYAGGTLYVSLGFGDLVALDAATGAVRWRQRLDGTGGGQPLVSDGLVYVVSGDDTGWAINAADGRVAWQVAATPSPANVLGAPAPAISGRLVVFAFGSGELIATFRQGGLGRWNASVTGQQLGRALSRINDITGAPVAVGGRLYVGNQSGRLVALDGNNGDRFWTAGEGTIGPVWPAGDSIFAVTDRLQLARIDAGSGQVIWAQDLPGYVDDRPRRRSEVVAHHGPILAGGRLVVASNDGLLRSFSPQDGRLLGTTEVPGGATTAPALAGGTLYVVSTTGQLHAFR